MTPGIYENLPFEQYLQIEAISNSRLGLMGKSPLHYRTCAAPDEKSKPLVLGQLVHCGRLEPMSIAERYAVQPDYHLDAENVTDSGKPSQSKATRWCRDKCDQFAEANRDKDIVSREWYAEAKQIVDAVCRCDEANALLNAPGPCELTLVWHDDETGLPCKARMDKAAPALGKFADLKTTADIGKFQRAIVNYGYHRQMAHYQEGWAVLRGGELLEPWLIPVEKKEPFCAMAAPLDEEALMAGYQQRRVYLNRVAECLESGEWPGPPSPKCWRVPEYALLAEV